MNIEKVIIENEGYVHCQSCFYTSQDGMSEDERYFLTTGVNKLQGEIDSGVWAVSYFLSMYKYKPKDFILFNNAEVIVNDKKMSVTDFSRYSCYMDKSYPLFKSHSPIKKIVMKGIHENKMNCSSDEVRELFKITPERFERSLSSAGNEIFKAMAAIAYSYNKQVYCLPWLSKRRFDSYHNNMTDLLEILEKLEKIVILPMGK